MSEGTFEQKRALSKELYYGIETSITMLTMGEKLKWYKGVVMLGHDRVQLTNPEYSINLEDIQIVGRIIPASCINSIFKGTRQSAHLLVEYNKMGKLGLVYSAQTIFAGESETIEELKLYFKESIPDRVWGALAVSGDELRLLYLLFCGITDMRVLVPMFGDVNTVEKLFQTLIKKELVDAKGNLTKDGFTHITESSEKAPPIELGTRAPPEFDRFFSARGWIPHGGWSSRESGRYIKTTRVKVSVLPFEEPLTGFIKVSDLWYVLKVLNVREFELGKHPVEGLEIRAFFGVHGEVIISPKNDDVLLKLVFLIYTTGDLVKLSDELKVLNALSLGISEPAIIMDTCRLSSEHVDQMLTSYIKNRITTPTFELTAKGRAWLEKLYNAHRTPMVDRIYPPSSSADNPPDTS